MTMCEEPIYPVSDKVPEPCGNEATVETFGTLGLWKPSCERHAEWTASYPDRVRPLTGEAL